jgi:PAS domain S-box-containing protein
MDNAQLRLDRALNEKGNVVTSLIVLSLIGLYVWADRIEWVSLISLIIVLASIQIVQTVLKRRGIHGQRVAISGFAVYHALYVWIIGFLLPPGDPFMLIGILITSMSTYLFGKQGAMISLLVIINSVIASYVLRPDILLDATATSLMVGFTLMIILVCYFTYSILDVAEDQVDEILQSTEKARLEHQRLLTLINNMGDAVIATDEQGTIITYNGAALELLDTNESLNERNIKDVMVLKNTEKQEVDLITETDQSQGHYRRTDLSLYYDEDDMANLYINITPIKIGYGQEVQRGFTLIMRDISKEKSLEEERDEFISVVSHELRTPITITEGKISNAQIMLKNNNTDKLESALEEAHNQIVFLAAMINDLSTLSRAERDNLNLDIELVEPNKLVQSIVESYRPEAEQHGLHISAKLADKELPQLNTSRLYLQEIIQNFVTNSLKYTREGGVTLAVEPARENGKVVFSVTDTGIGISKSDQKRLFEKFFRSEDYRTRESGGTGLGLYVTAKLAQKLGAQIDVSSKLDHGSTFTITIGSLEQKTSHQQHRDSDSE